MAGNTLRPISLVPLGDDVPSDMLNHPAVAGNINLLGAWIESRMAYSGVPGLSIAVVADQQILWQCGFGHANVERNEAAAPDTIYRIASITKLFTATAIMQLRDGGKLQLDDPLLHHLPWFNIRERFPDEPPITLRHLLTHTAGLPREPAFPHWVTSQFPTLSQIREKLGEQETVLARDAKLKYSNLALALAGEVVAAVSGVPYADYVRTQILKPLRMDSTFVAPVPVDHPRLATGYGRRLPDGTRALSPYTDGQGLTPAFNMATTVSDLAQFAMLQFRVDGKQENGVLAPRTLREMHRVHYLGNDWQQAWGIGFSVWRDEGHTYVGHGGAVLGSRTRIALRPADKIGVIVFTNADDGLPEAYVMRAFRWLAPAIAAARAHPDKADKADPAWQAYVGKYRNVWRDTEVLVRNGELLAIDPTLDDPLQLCARLRPEGDHTFRREEKHYGGRHGELLRFEMGADGRAVRMVEASGAHSERVLSW